MPTIVIDGSPKMDVVQMSEVTLVRTYSAGVHFGIVHKRKGKEVILKNARRLWSWSGACSLNQVAMEGVDLKESKITMVVPEITLTEAIELIPMTKGVSKQMMGAEAWKK